MEVSRSLLSYLQLAHGLHWRLVRSIRDQPTQRIRNSLIWDAKFMLCTVRNAMALRWKANQTGDSVCPTAVCRHRLMMRPATRGIMLIRFCLKSQNTAASRTPHRTLEAACPRLMSASRTRRSGRRWPTSKAIGQSRFLFVSSRSLPDTVLIEAA